MLLYSLVALLPIACSSSEQIQQQDQQTAAADTTQQNQPQPANDDNAKDEQQIEALKEKYREQLREDYQTKANEITTFYILAQRRYYNGDYKSALSIVNKALEIRENADLHGLKGSIYLELNNVDKFEEHWRQALTMDADVPLPLTNRVIEKLKERGLLNENLERNF